MYHFEAQNLEFEKKMTKKSGNPSGKAKPWGEWIRSHPKVPSLLQKLFETSFDENDPNQWKAIALLVDRIAPHLKATEIKLDAESTQGVIVLPEKKIRSGREERVKTIKKDDQIASA